MKKNREFVEEMELRGGGRLEMRNEIDGDLSLADDTTTNDEGNPSPVEDTTANDPEPVTESDTYTGTTTEIEKAKERNGHPHRSAKPTTKANDYLYF